MDDQFDSCACRHALHNTNYGKSRGYYPSVSEMRKHVHYGEQDDNTNYNGIPEDLKFVYRYQLNR